MQTYIALLRGINVGGHNKIKMADLKAFLQKEGFQKITTYIQSGNIIFKSDLHSTHLIENKIKNVVLEKFGHNINVLIKTKNEILTVFENNPFIKSKNVEITKLHVSFLKNSPNTEEVANLKSIDLTNNDAFEVVKNTMYLYCPINYAKTKLNNNLIEKKLNTSSTTRNWKTITKLVELSQIE